MISSFTQRFVYFLSFISLTFLLCGCGKTSRKEISDKIRKHLEIFSKRPDYIEGDLILNPEILTHLYENKEIILEKWGNKGKAEELLTLIRNVSYDGLRPEDYHLHAIEKLVEKIYVSRTHEAEDIARLELLLTDAFLMISSHLSAGKTDPATIDPQWNAARREAVEELERFVDSALANQHILESLRNFTPSHREYNNLKKALAKYREIERNGGWESFSTTLPKLALGTTHPDVALLRQRLIITQGNVYRELEDENLFDQTLHEQVVLFQQRSGLTADGVVSKATIEAMNIPVSERIASIEANLERWRWISNDLGSRYIKVNIANFEMQVVENDKPVFISQAIVGRPYRKTPVFSSKMDHLVLAPTWTVPPTILAQDLIPAVRKNLAYLSQKNMQVLRRDGSVVDPSQIDWKNINASNFPYRIRQAPGKDNALGAAKFMFPNKYSVYIHDTPTRNLFVHADRSFSSGCIRISRPLELAEFLLKDKEDWPLSRIKKVVERGKETTIFITNPIPVHLLYLTVWAEDDGSVHFRKDIYDRDQPLLNALKAAPPAGGELSMR